jgi:glycosyltransferase involved in cell wall biosynthesis
MVRVVHCMSSPTVSIVMTVFNGQAFLSEAIESILGQNFRDFEFLIIDDGSADRTRRSFRVTGAEPAGPIR